jgi:hypothetical protein
MDEFYGGGGVGDPDYDSNYVSNGIGPPGNRDSVSPVHIDIDVEGQIKHAAKDLRKNFTTIDESM